MMTEDRRAADQKIKEENLFKSLGAGEQEAETEGFQCGRCKQASRIFIHARRGKHPPSASAITVKHRREAPMNP